MNKNDTCALSGECTNHARICGLGTGMFFLLQKHCVLLVRGERSCFSSSIYIDSHGEPGVDGGCRPLFLAEGRFKRLQEMWVRGDISKEVARCRDSQQQIIRLSFY